MTLREPLLLAPLPVEKVWGGRRLAELVDGSLDPSDRLGEVWALSDREERASTVASGSFAGRNLRGLMLSEREALLGAAAASSSGSFPLLIKFIEAAEDLSVQVHPDERAAARFGSESKHECWFILAAEPGSEIYLGLAEGVDAPTFASRSASPDVVDLLRRFPVCAGEFVEIPAGTVHSIGAGVTLLEVQENSDTTYRVYDWGRVGLDGAPRQTHLEQALGSIDYGAKVVGPFLPKLGPLAPGDTVNRRAKLCANNIYIVDLLEIHRPARGDTAGVPSALVVLSGSGALQGGDMTEPMTLRRGQCWLLPADLGGFRIKDVDGELRLLQATARS